MKNDLDKLRKEIDKLDDELLHIFAKRIEIVKKIGTLKNNNNLPLVDKKRKNELLELITKKAESLGLSKEFIKSLYSLIHDHAVKIQASIVKDKD